MTSESHPLHEAKPFDVPCVWCEARPGVPCVGSIVPHVHRIKAAREAR